MKYSEIISEEKVRLDPKCWTGKKIGNPKTKMKGGVRVNNCVPAESVAEGADERKQNALWAQITDYEKRAKATSNDIKKQHLLKMANELRGKLKTNVDEGVNNVGANIKALYQKIYRAGDDEIEYFYNDSPIFAQYWDEYEGDLDSIIAEVDPGELQVMLDELESYVQQANLAEGEVVAFPKKHKGDLDSVDSCVKCHGDLQGGTYMGHKVKVCIPCKQVYLPPNSGIDQQGNKIKEQGVAEAAKGILHRVRYQYDDPSGAGIASGHITLHAPDKAVAARYAASDLSKKGKKNVKVLAVTPQKQGVAEEYNAEYDDEAGMAQGSLHTLKNAVEGLQQVIDSGDNLPEWCQEKISLAEDYLVTVWDYLQSEKAQGIDPELNEEFDLIESIIDRIAAQNGVDSEIVWDDLESLTEDELYAFAVTSQLNEDWQKANKSDRTDGMSRKAVKAYRRAHPGSKLQTAVTTKPSKLKKGSKASKRRKSYCSRSKGQMNMHNISCAKTPDKAICKARRRWNC